MNATKLAVAGFFTLTLMLAANTQVASAAPYHGPIGHYAFHGAHWGHRPIYSGIRSTRTLPSPPALQTQPSSRSLLL